MAKMGTSILWYQPERMDDQDVIIYNGERVEDALKRTEYFGIIRRQAELVLKKQKPWCGLVRGFFFMKGHLDRKDELGRTMSFMYITDSTNYKEALMRELELANLSLSTSSQSCLTKKERLTALQTALITIVVFAVIAFIIYSLKR
jgi:hypothetical protein